MSGRIDQHHILKFDRGKEVKINYKGETIKAFENETIAPALHASGKISLTRSCRYHRPRGMFCAIGKCASCLMNVNGAPNVKTCQKKVKDRMKIEPQNCWPSPDHDFFRFMDKIKTILLKLK